MTREEIRHEEARCDFLTDVLFDIGHAVYRERRTVTDAERDQMQRISVEIGQRRVNVERHKRLFDLGVTIGSAARLSAPLSYPTFGDRLP